VTSTKSTKSTQKQVSAPKAAPTKKPPPTKPFTNGLFKPLTDNQVDMLEREYYTNKNMVGRDKLYFILKRKYGSKAPTQKAINDWLVNQKTHQLHRRQFKSQTITPIRNVRVPNQLWMADLIDMGSKPDKGYKWILTVVDAFSKYAWAVPKRLRWRGAPRVVAPNLGAPAVFQPIELAPRRGF
jgi:hypothetical protein